MVINSTKFPTFVQDFNGYAIDGDMPYANTNDVVLCITGDGKVINALFSIFKAEHSNLPYEFERRQLYLAAEGDAPKLGYIAKSPSADPNHVMPFFHKWGNNCRILPSHGQCSKWAICKHAMLTDISFCSRIDIITG